MSSTGWACCRWVRPGITAPRCARPCCGQRVDEVEQLLGERPGVVEQVHPQQGGDLVVARPAGAQPAAQLGADLLEQQPLQGAVHVLVDGSGSSSPAS